MRVSVRWFDVSAGVAAALLACSPPADAAGPFEKSVYLSGPRYDAIVPPCTAGLATIQERFAAKEGRFWNSNLHIVDFKGVRQVAFRPWAENTIPRRFCSARVLVSDGRWRQVHYSIVEDGGIISATFGVQWCVTGLDRNWAYAPNCKMALP